MTPELLLTIILVGTVGLYVVTGGADFGGGVWELFARGPRKGAQRDAVKHAIAPIWEANHVWLIFVVVLLFVCYPKAFSILLTVLHIPLTLMLIGIVLRGAAFAFRSYSAGDRKLERQSVRVFAVSSVVTPIMLGVSAGAVASGDFRVVDGVVQTNFYSEWLGLFPFAVGFLLLALCAWLAAVYMAFETREDPELCADFCRRAYLSGPVVFVMGGVTLLAAFITDAHVAQWFSGPSGVGLLSFTALPFIGVHVALHRGRFLQARRAAVAVGLLLIAGWAFAQFPWIVPELVTFKDAAPRDVLIPVLWAIGAGTVLLVPSFWYLYRLFGK